VTLIQSSVEVNEFTVQTRRLVAPECSLCNKEIEFVEGDTIYGDKWYHNSCWKLFSVIEENVSNS
jgi:hypothetical protein